MNLRPLGPEPLTPEFSGNTPYVARVGLLSPQYLSRKHSGSFIRDGQVEPKTKVFARVAVRVLCELSSGRLYYLTPVVSCLRETTAPPAQKGRPFYPSFNKPSQNLNQRPTLRRNHSAGLNLAANALTMSREAGELYSTRCHLSRLRLPFKQGEFMTQQQIERRRKMFFIGISLLATAITMASFGATYAVNTRSFADWRSLGWAFALLASIGLEATFALTLYGVAHALVGTAEKGFGVALLVGTVIVMAMNYTTHHAVTTRAPLSPGQVAYIQWVGPLSLFGILSLIVGIIVFNHDARKRRLEREVAYAAERKALEWEQSQLESDALEEHMAQYQPQVFEKVRRALTLPSLPPPPRRATGFRVEDERSEQFPNE